ncbi:NCS2 family permease [Streptococcus cuniculipharyngis]|uniref:NCS2 family permease n=1 Tax=Streptococcus cuniculipharyngis TaxID=1562651 RepID=A0A5C5SBY5_9STRE|nr:NCS2 family permease [Streptococcus cuniculipharyngis]TWS96692.1 NCS2 family permease [Streptococcus cuniculipharyngis]
METFFKLKEHGTDVRTEVMAGITTFFAMSYILFVNPSMLAQTGMPLQGVFLSTIIGSVVGTLIMALYANVPYAQAPGMGMNAFFTYTVVFSLGYTWQEALAMVFLCGCISIAVTLTRLRHAIIVSIPENLKHAIGGGIGIFLTYLGLKNAGLLSFTLNPQTYTVLGEGADKAAATILGNSSAVPALVPFDNVGVIVSLIAIVITAVLLIRNVRGGVMIAMLATTLVALAFGIVSLSTIDFASNNIVTAFGDLKTVFGAAFTGLGTLFADSSRTVEVIMTVFAFALTDMFDTIGTLIGTSQKTQIFDTTSENARDLDPKLKKAMYADVFGSTAGAIAGTSNVTTYVESAAGIAAGGRTGLTALVVAGLFLVSSFFSPLLSIIPTQATAAVLIMVGVMMISNLKSVDWDDMSEAIPAFFASIFMGFGYSITNGIAFGFLFYTIGKLVQGRVKEIQPIIWILDLLFIINFMLM